MNFQNTREWVNLIIGWVIAFFLALLNQIVDTELYYDLPQTKSSQEQIVVNSSVLWNVDYSDPT